MKKNRLITPFGIVVARPLPMYNGQVPNDIHNIGEKIETDVYYDLFYNLFEHKHNNNIVILGILDIKKITPHRKWVYYSVMKKNMIE